MSSVMPPASAESSGTDADELLMQEERPSMASWRPARGILLGLLSSAAVLALCAALAYRGHPAERARGISVRELVASSELADIVSESMAAVHHGSAESRAETRAKVQERAQEIADALEHPEFDELVLTDEERRAVLHSMSLLQDSRMRQLAAGIAEAMGTHLHAPVEKREKAALKRTLLDKFAKQQDFVQQLRAEVIPKVLLGKQSGRRQWSKGVDVEKMRVVQDLMEGDAQAFMTARRLMQRVKDPVTDHFTALFDLLSLKFDKEISVPGVREVSERRLTASASSVYVTCETGTATYHTEKPCDNALLATTAQLSPMLAQCNPYCTAYSDVMSCIQGGKGLTEWASCLEQAPSVTMSALTSALSGLTGGSANGASGQSFDPMTWLQGILNGGGTTPTQR